MRPFAMHNIRLTLLVLMFVLTTVIARHKIYNGNEIE